MLIGYARVSTQDQTLDLQKDALQKIGCTKIFTEIASGSLTARPGLQEAVLATCLIQTCFDRFFSSRHAPIIVMEPIQDGERDDLSFRLTGRGGSQRCSFAALQILYLQPRKRNDFVCDE